MPSAPDMLVQGPGFYALVDNGFASSSSATGPAPFTQNAPSEALPSSLAEKPAEPLAINAGTFGMRRIYAQRPVDVPDLQVDPGILFTPLAEHTVARSSRSVSDIIAPYPNITAWRWNHNFWSVGDTRSITFRKNEQLLARHPDFNANNFASADFEAIEATVLATKSHPWDDVRDGWRRVNLTIGVPVGIPRTESEKKNARNRRQRLRRDRDIADAPSPKVEGRPYMVEGAWMRSLTGVIKHVWEHDPLARQFHMNGFEERGPSPVLDTGNPSGEGSLSAHEERVMREIYDSPEFQRVEAEVQAKLGATTNRPIVVIALMIWSDATHLAQFGNAKLWPVYMYFGNLSKYIRTKRSAKAAYHVAYLPSVSFSV
jgi:hypothetical protein